LPIDLFLSLAGISKLSFGHEQRMIAALDDVKKIWRFHFAPNVLEQVERAERISSALHEQDRRSQIAQDFVPQAFWISGAAKRIPEANKTRDRFFKGNVATDSSAHALSDQDHGLRHILSRISQRLAVRGDEQRWGIGPAATFAHVVIIESVNVPNGGESFRPCPHPGMG
jgi:hypothetical protein